jgi:vacuolar-type H+-ATPase subunit E/Vma4
VEQSLLFESMTREARAQCGERLAEARREAEAIEAAGAKRCAEDRECALDAAQSKMDERRSDARMAAEAEAGRLRRTLEGTVAEEALAEAEKAIRAIAVGPEFPHIIEELLEEAVDGVDGEFSVFAPPDHACIVRRWLDSHGLDDVEAVPDTDVADGVIVQDAGRTFRITNTLRERFEMLRDKSRALCVEILFGDGSGGEE